MSISPAKPLGDRAAELAFKFDEICPMSLTFFDSSSDRVSSTDTTHQVLRLEFSLRLIVVLTRLQASEVWLLAFKAHVVREPSHGIWL